MKHRPVIAGLLAAVLLFGCDSVEHRIRKNPEMWDALSPSEKLAVENKTIDIGHSPEVVYLIMGNPNRKKSKAGGQERKEVWIYTRIYTQYEGTDIAGYHRRVYYDSINKVFRVYYIPEYVTLFSEHMEVVTEIEFEDGQVSAITEVER